jgi:hypothetical protein
MTIFDGKVVGVVSNSPDLLGRGLGQEIDACELVVRFNRFKAGGEYAIDVGSKTDVYVAYYLGCKSKKEVDALGVKEVFLCRNCDESFNWPPLLKVKQHIEHLRTIDIINGYLLNGAFSTTGLTFIYWLLTYTRPQRIVLFGFGNEVHDGHYYNLDHKMTKHHDLCLEHDIIDTLYHNIPMFWKR